MPVPAMSVLDRNSLRLKSSVFMLFILPPCRTLGRERSPVLPTEYRYNLYILTNYVKNYVALEVGMQARLYGQFSDSSDMPVYPLSMVIIPWWTTVLRPSDGRSSRGGYLGMAFWRSGV
jgi:hypothetical protein